LKPFRGGGGGRLRREKEEREGGQNVKRGKRER